MSEEQSTPLINYHAIIRIDASINAQMGSGEWHPRAVYHDNFFLRFEGQSEQEIVALLKEKLEELKKKWQEEGGEIGVFSNAVTPSTIK